MKLLSSFSWGTVHAIGTAHRIFYLLRDDMN